MFHLYNLSILVGIKSSNGCADKMEIITQSLTYLFNIFVLFLLLRLTVKSLCSSGWFWTSVLSASFPK